MMEVARTRPLGVLIVDDCADTTSSLALLIEAWGHEALVANDGSTALRLASESRPDVVILDIGMPRMSGLEVARRLRQLPGLDGALVVAMSGYASEDDSNRSLQAGCNLHLVKPPDLQHLRRLLATRRKETATHDTQGTDSGPARDALRRGDRRGD
jgi:two-component system CheB/CheR fusion protein